MVELGDGLAGTPVEGWLEGLEVLGEAALQLDELGKLQQLQLVSKMRPVLQDW